MQEQDQNIVEVFENDIQLYLSMFCEENGSEDMKKESQSVWNGALRYIRRHVFNNKDLLKEPNNIYNINNSITSNYNMYNYELVNNICDIYIDLCFINDKEVSILGFSNLTGIDNETINIWGNNDNKLSSLSFVSSAKLNFLTFEAPPKFCRLISSAIMGNLIVSKFSKRANESDKPLTEAVVRSLGAL